MRAKNLQPILIFACGNPSRGDDALGPELIERLDRELKNNSAAMPVELLTDFQFQIEHAIDLHGRKTVIFVDANVATTAPYKLCKITPQQDLSYTTHSMSPAGVLEVYEQLYTDALPDCWQLSIRGYEFALGSPLTDSAQNNLLKALDAVKKLIFSDAQINSS